MIKNKHFNIKAQKGHRAIQSKKENQVKDKGFVFLSLLLVLLSILYLVHINQEKTENYKASGGSINLGAWDGKEIVDLDGDWEFYPRQLIDPRTDDFEEEPRTLVTLVMS